MENEIRAFPIRPDFTGDKKINDIIYGYYQANSQLTEDNRRFCYKKDVTASKMGKYFKELPVSVSTITNINKLLIKGGFLKEGEVKGKKVYFLPDLNKGEQVFIKLNTLRYLVDTASTNVIKIYSYLKLKQMQHINLNFQEPYRFSKTELLKVIGYPYGRTHQEQLQMIENILTCLTNNGLIEYHLVRDPKYTNVGVYYHALDAVNEEQKKQEKDILKEKEFIAIPIK